MLGSFLGVCVFLGPHPWDVKVPRLPSTPQPQQCQIRASSVTYTIAHGNAESLIHWARPGIEPVSSSILVRFVSAEPRWELWCLVFKKKKTPQSCQPEPCHPPRPQHIFLGSYAGNPHVLLKLYRWLFCSLSSLAVWGAAGFWEESQVSSAAGNLLCREPLTPPEDYQGPPELCRLLAPGDHWGALSCFASFPSLPGL